ncbi:MAG: septal ring lytic transglycosylase RlpA family protein [Proteobacteria bacterium]|nr:septal ring lytic transglycosylase RlpA family protein [Pseudomonadota bacterium]
MSDFITSRLRATTILVLGMFVLAACAETQLALHTAKRMTRSTDGVEKAPGAYKVGKPYQINGVWYYPGVDYGYAETGVASWYGPQFHGKKTANGEVFDMNDITAAHRTLPLPSMVQVTNLENGRSLKVRVNDRGPFAHGRIIDMSRRSAQLLGFSRQGTAKVRVQVLADESRRLAQGLTPTQVASNQFPVQVGTTVAKPSVNASSLPPPPGGSVANGSGSTAPARVAAVSRERITLKPPETNGVVTTVPVTPTQIYVQAGAFSQHRNAYQVAVRLNRIKNIKITSSIVNGKEFFRVRAGPFVELEDADLALDQVIGSGYPNARLVVE